jgi:hypothetical protein
MTPLVAPEAARHWIVATVGAQYLYVAIVNAWASRGRHFGWMAMSAIVALAVASIERARASFSPDATT